jgi:hypothetical protein
MKRVRRRRSPRFIPSANGEWGHVVQVPCPILWYPERELRNELFVRQQLHI